MLKKRLVLVLVYGIAGVAMLAATGCAHLGAPAGNSEEALLRRVTAEWEAKVRKDWGAVYDLAVNAYKEKVTRNQLIKRANVNIQEFSIQEVNITEPGKKALAVVNYSMNPMGFTFKATAREEWLWEDREWRLDLTPFLAPPLGFPTRDSGNKGPLQ